jgi:hypothetical protein
MHTMMKGTLAASIMMASLASQDWPGLPGSADPSLAPSALPSFAPVDVATLFLPQDEPEDEPETRRRWPRFRAGAAFGFGELEHRTDGTNLDGEADAVMFRGVFEFVGGIGIGGGARIEFAGTDDDLFDDAGFNATEAGAGSVFLHFTGRLTTRRFLMPVRVGLMTHFYSLDDTVVDQQTKYFSIGPYFEMAPEVFLMRQRHFTWSLFGEIGAGFGATAIDDDSTNEEYDSDSTFLGAEGGMRFVTGPVQFGISYVFRRQEMDDSDVEGGFFVPGFEAEFQGLLFSAAAIF